MDGVETTGSERSVSVTISKNLEKVRLIVVAPTSRTDLYCLRKARRGPKGRGQLFCVVEREGQRQTRGFMERRACLPIFAYL